MTGQFEFATDSPLEEAVSSELVSDPKFPAGWENAGNFVDSGLNDASKGAKKGAKSVAPGTNSLRSPAGNFLHPCRELNRGVTENFRADQKILSAVAVSPCNFMNVELHLSLWFPRRISA